MRLMFFCAALVVAAMPRYMIGQAAPTASVRPSGVGQAYFEFQVEKPVAPKPGNPHPRYPYEMRATAHAGEVEAQFVVDTLGRVDMGTFEVLRSTDKSFTNSVKDVLPSLHYDAAEIDGRKVRQLVQQDFRFAAQ